MGSSPEGEVTVLAEETVAGGDGSNSTKSKTGASVLLKRDVKTRTKKSFLKKKSLKSNYRKPLVRVSVHRRKEGAKASEDLLLLRT